MRIKIERRISELDIEHQEGNLSYAELQKLLGREPEEPSRAEKDEGNSSAEESEDSSAPKPSSDERAMKKFTEYVNHSRGNFSIGQYNHFSGSYKLLKKLADGFEKRFKGAKVYISYDYIEGEAIPMVERVTYNGGDK